VRPFLTARWVDLCLFTYAVPPDVLAPRLPAGLSLDTRDGHAFVSLVAFDFLDTRVFGVGWPGFRNFPEINLRFYVRQGDRRGVVFIRELVPLRTVAYVAQAIYNEPYQAVQMESRVQRESGRIEAVHRLRVGRKVHRVRLLAADAPFRPSDDSVEHFFKEHRWGFGSDTQGRATVYEVIHEVWNCYAVQEYSVELDWAVVYGDEWAFLQDATPYHVAFAAGSPIEVYPRGAL